MLRSQPQRKHRKLSEEQQDVHSKPEKSLTLPKEFFSGKTPVEYHSQNQLIQTELTNAAISLFNLHNSNLSFPFILDIGCGSGLSYNIIRQSITGSILLGFDVSRDMLEIAKNYLIENDHFSELYQGDLSIKFPLKDQMLDGILSISAIQWISEKSSIELFLKECYRVMKDESCAVFQFYPNNPEHADLFVNTAKEIGFSQCNLILDIPHRTPQKKWFLFILKSTQDRDKNCTLPNCFLSYPYNASCVLCLQKKYGIELVVSEKLNSSKNCPLSLWLLRSHITKAIELVKGFKKLKFPSQSESLVQVTSLQEVCCNCNSFDDFYLKKDLILKTFHQ